MSRNNYDAIIIGAGIGGLACAASLSLIGKKVLLLEQHRICGGYLQNYRRKHWNWDVGLHYMTDMAPGNPYRRLLDHLTRNRITFTRLPLQFQKLIFGDFDYTVLNNSQQMKQQLQNDFRSQQSEIDTYWEYMERISANLRYYLACKRYSPTVAQLLLPLFSLKYSRFKNKTHQEVLDELFTDPRLKKILSFTWPTLGSPPDESSFIIHALSQDHIFNGTYYPNGGGKFLIESFLSTILENGGEILMKTRVNQICVSNKRAAGIVCNQDQFIAADQVVSAIGIPETVNRLLSPDAVPKTLKKSIARHRLSFSCILLAVGLQGDISKLKIDHGSYRIFSDNMFKLANDPSIEQWDPPSVFISLPSQHKNAHKDTNHHTLHIITNINYDFFARWENSQLGQRGPEYTALKEKITADLLGILEKTIPGIRKFIAFTDLSTPLTNEHYVHRENGAIYGLQLTPQRMFDMNLVPKTKIKGLYFSGADIFAHGIVQGIASGILTAGVCSNENLFSRFLKSAQ